MSNEMIRAHLWRLDGRVAGRLPANGGNHQSDICDRSPTEESDFPIRFKVATSRKDRLIGWMG